MATALTNRSFLSWSEPADRLLAALGIQWRRARVVIAIFTALAIIAALPPLGLVHPSLSRRTPVTSGFFRATLALPSPAASASGQRARLPERTFPLAPGGASGLSSVLPSAASEVTIDSAGDPANCHGVVSSTLAQFGYTPGALAKTTPGAQTAGSINKAIRAACSSGIAAPQ